MSLFRPERAARGLGPARFAFAVGLAYAAVSAYWGLGGTWLLNTVGSALPQLSRTEAPLALSVVWAAAGLKVVAAALPLLVVRSERRSPPRATWRRASLRGLVWAEAAVLCLYGLALTVAELLAESGVVVPPPGADRLALAWHAYLWDPGFLLWGLLVAATMVRTRPAAGETPR